MPGHFRGSYEVLELLANVAKTLDLSSLTDETGKTTLTLSIKVY
jgi:hypothetical protein